MPDKIGSIPILWTLQRYIFHEMGRTFVLTAAALTGILGLGGGVLDRVGLTLYIFDKFFNLLDQGR